MKSRLYLVDAHAYLHRAYHALPPLNNAKGEPVGALYGFARMLLQLVKKEKPDLVAVCFDHPQPTFRHKAFPAYKATRKEIDPDLIAQLKKAEAMAQAMGFTTVELPGYEADDIMATLARRASREGLDAVLVTGDKDALQMVGPGIRVLKDVANGVWMDASQIEEKLGVGPASVIDYLTIIGDAADNVPGIKGIGPVGAAKLLKQYGTLAKAFKAAKAGDPAIPAKTAKILCEAEEGAKAAAALLKLEDDAPVHINPKNCALPQPEPDRLIKTFSDLGFNSLLKEMIPLQQSVAAIASPAAAGAPALDERPFKELQKDLAGAKTIVVAALANNGNLVDSSRFHLALGLEDGRVSFLQEDSVKAAAAVLGAKALKVGYGLKEAAAALELLRLKLAEPWFDAMIAAYCLSPVRPAAETAVDGDWKGALSRRVAKALDYKSLRGQMEKAGVLKLYQDIEMPLISVLREMERDGIGLDEAYLRQLSSEFESEIAALKIRLDEMAGAPINVNSPKQLAELLFDKLKLPVVHKTAKGGRSTDEECLKILAGAHPLPAKVLEYRELTKLKSTYIEGLLDRLDRNTGRVHTTFDQTGTETGRVSSLNPNLQNIPIRSRLGQKIRRAFTAGSGRLFVAADYSQIDLRVLAHVSQDAVLKDAFAKQEDVHLRTACEVFRVDPQSVDGEMRRRAKAVNFGIVYGQSPFGLAGELGIPQREAADIIHKYFERYQGVARWMEKNLLAARHDGFVRTFLGRLRHLPELAAKNTALRQFGERAARNTPIQGGSADVIKVAMLKVHEGLPKFKAKMLLQIHDELLFELPASEVKEFSVWVRRTMENAVVLSVPLVVDVKVGKNWQDMEKSLAPVFAGERR